MNSISLAFILLVSISIISATTFDIDEVEFNEEIFHSRFADHEAEVESVTIDLRDSNSSVARSIDCPEIVTLPNPKNYDVSACFLKTGVKTSTKEHNTLSCIPMDRLYKTVPDNLQLEVYECKSFDRRTGQPNCNRQLIKKYRDYFITNNKVCISKSNNQICLGRPYDEKCIRFYDFKVPILPKQCDAVFTSIIVGNNQPSIKEFGKCVTKCVPTTAVPDIKLCTQTGCFLNKPFSLPLRIEAAAGGVKRSEHNKREACVSHTFPAGDVSLYMWDFIMGGSGCQYPAQFSAVFQSCGEDVRIDYPPSEYNLADGKACLNDFDCAGKCDIASFISGNIPKAPGVCVPNQPPPP